MNCRVMAFLTASLPLALPQYGARQDEKLTDQRYIQPARYLAASISDPRANGYGRSDNYPTRIQNQEWLNGRLNTIVSRDRETVHIRIANGTARDKWLNAANGNLRAVLQAKDAKGRWRSIQFVWWQDCGNSYHRVQLPPGEEWQYTVPLPRGTLTTKLRLSFLVDKTPMFSREITASIPPSRFELASSDAMKWTVIQPKKGIAVGFPFPMTKEHRMKTQELYDRSG